MWVVVKVAWVVVGADHLRPVWAEPCMCTLSQAMASVVAGLMEAVGAAEKVIELIDRQPKIDHHSGTEKPDKLAGVVEFRGVSFSYPTRPNVQVLKGVSFTAQPGEMVALVG